MSGDVESELQNTAKIISTVKLQSWTPPPPLKSRIGKWYVLAFAGLHPSIFFWWEWRGGGGGEEGGGDGNLLLHDLLGGCFLGVGIALLLHFPVFYRVLL